MSSWVLGCSSRRLCYLRLCRTSGTTSSNAYFSAMNTHKKNTSPPTMRPLWTIEALATYIFSRTDFCAQRTRRAHHLITYLCALSRKRHPLVYRFNKYWAASNFECLFRVWLCARSQKYAARAPRSTLLAMHMHLFEMMNILRTPTVHIWDYYDAAMLCPWNNFMGCAEQNCRKCVVSRF